MNMERLNLDKRNLRKFGMTMAIVFSIITILILIRHRHSILPTAIISVIFFVSALVMPNSLKTIYIIWMKLAFFLSWINTRLILFIIFYLVFTPMGLVIRLFGIDLLDRKIEKKRQSYWKKREKIPFSQLNYERQF